MTDTPNLAPELQRIADFYQLETDAYDGLRSIHDAVEQPLRHDFDHLPASAQGVLGSFERLHASVSYNLLGATAETLRLTQEADLSEEQRASHLESVLARGIKLMLKNVKAARRDPVLKRQLNEPFAD
ncbi:DUF3069 domain-containing protein [Ferrimonas sediminicola]|uniref:DUF3069 domain-containing protein n=1 Tax=Ferrimonas sediminicola TaxID=2569538 RepID=A0A4U1BGM0_9GAMM|nr:DUF3069 domain-containing protein [Ferrimonas sediminicola]TKB50482.1 DUF3069 domain-containing protein [Ferrimonas sediminicola]